METDEVPDLLEVENYDIEKFINDIMLIPLEDSEGCEPLSSSMINELVYLYHDEVGV